MHPDFDRIVDDAFSRLQAGEEINQILARYPEHAARLAPLLETAAFCVRAYEHVEPASIGRMARARDRYLTMARQRAARRKPRRRLAPWPTRWAMAVAALVLAFLLGAAAVTASAGSVPGDLLYPVKTMVEGVQIAMTRDPAERATLHMTWSQRRVMELKILLQERGQVNTTLVEASRSEALAALQEIARLPEAERKSLLAMYAVFAGAQAQTLELQASAAPAPRRAVLDQAADEYRALASLAQAAQTQPEILEPVTGPVRPPTPTPTGTPTRRPTSTKRPVPTPTPTPTRRRPVIATAVRGPTRSPTVYVRPTRTPTPTQRARPTRTPTRRPPVSAATATRPVAVTPATVAPAPTRPTRVATAVPRRTATPTQVRRRPTPTPTRQRPPTRTPVTREPTATPTQPARRPTPTPTPPLQVTGFPTPVTPATTPVPAPMLSPTPASRP
jgi:hypothetical protein